VVDYRNVVTSFAHIVRDWTKEGSEERKQVFPPILDALKRSFANIDGEKKVLVPGSGLGRLAHEIANQSGFAVDACELDYNAILAYHYVLNSSSPLEHTFYPFVTQWTHQSKSTLRFTPIRFPDVLPASHVRLIEGDFLIEFPESEVYDAIVTLFFIDIGENIIDFLSTIHRLLKPGGLWINLGPFKWGSHTQMQPSAEEVLELANMIGFDIDHGSHRSIDTVYGSQPEALLKYTYVTRFWTARKRQ